MKQHRIINHPVRYFFLGLVSISLIGCGGDIPNTDSSKVNSTNPNEPFIEETGSMEETVSLKSKKLFAIAGDSKRDDDAAQQQIFYSRWLQEFNIDYLHTAITSIESAPWTKAQLSKILEKAKDYGTDGENVIIAYELGTNDIHHCNLDERIAAINNNDKEEENRLIAACKGIVLSSLKTGISAIQTTLPRASIYLSRPALVKEPVLKEIYEELAKSFNLLLVDSPIEKFQEKDRENPTKGANNFKYFKDFIHPSYAGMFSVLYADLNCILPVSEKSRLSKKVSESLYVNTSSKQGVNIAKNIPIDKTIRVFDEKTIEGEKFRSMTVPVIGGSILKIESPVKLHSITAVDKNNKGVDGNILTKSKIGVSLLRNKVNDNKKGLYSFIYIPKGTSEIIINFDIFDLEENDRVLEKTPITLIYASPEEMETWHPDLDEITSHKGRCIGENNWDMDIWK